ncbi:MAG: hypothetical protein MHM6MM_001571 [Cercozoa sp. M6MM]
MGQSFSYEKYKVQCKCAVARITQVNNKKLNLNKIERRAIAGLLKDGKEDTALIRIEGVIRTERLIKVLEVVQVMCEMLIQRAGLVRTSKTPPSDMEEAMATIIYAAPRVDEVPELREIAVQLRLKFGDKWLQAIRENRMNNVRADVVEFLGVTPPRRGVVLDTLAGVSGEFNCHWKRPVLDELEDLEQEQEQQAEAEAEANTDAVEREQEAIKQQEFEEQQRIRMQLQQQQQQLALQQEQLNMLQDQQVRQLQQKPPATAPTALPDAPTGVNPTNSSSAVGNSDNNDHDEPHDEDLDGPDFDDLERRFRDLRDM